MKKRLISLLLISLMILFCFAGCAEKTGDEIKEKIGEEASLDARTLRMFLMSEEKVSAEQEKLMEKKVNELTEKKYKIHLDLVYATADEYYSKLEANLKEMDSYYKKGTVGKPTETPVYTDENGLPAIYYPPIEDFDVDIFYFSGYEKYAQYKNAGYLKNLDEELSGSSKALKAVISNTLVDQFKVVNDGYYAIPTNRIIGEYTYILLNKDVLNATQYSSNDITSLVSDNCQDLLDMVSKEFSDYVPLYSEVDGLNMTGVRYFGADAAGLPTNKFSVIAGTYNSSWTLGATNSFPVMNSILSSADNGAGTISEQMNILAQYKVNGYYGSEEDSDKPFAVGYVTGGTEVVELYGDDYEVVPVGAPTLTHEDLYEHLFAVSYYTNGISESMEILTYLNTDVEFRNLLLYGVEGENYVWEDAEEIDANGDPYRVISRQTKDPEKLYMMDAFKTGNVAIAYPELGQDPIASERLLVHNADLVVDYVIGFSFFDGLKEGKIDKASFDALIALDAEAAEIYAELLAADTQEKVETAMAKFEELMASEDYAKVMSDAEGSTSPFAYYMSWLELKGLYKTAVEAK